jgi:hypothetical protein
MAATIEKAKANDPKLLQKRIAELERAAKSAPAQTIEKPVADERAIARAVAAATRPLQERHAAFVRDMTRMVRAMAKQQGDLVSASDAMREAITRANAALLAEESGAPASEPAPVFVPTPSSRPVAAPRASSRTVVSTEGVSVGMQRILDALAELRALGIQQPRRRTSRQRITTRRTCSRRRECRAALKLSWSHWYVVAPSLPVSYALGKKSPRYIWGQILKFLERTGAAPHDEEAERGTDEDR